MNIKNIGIAGLGLIGGSFAFAFHEKGFAVYGYDIHKATLSKAASSGIFDGLTDEIDVFLNFPLDLIYICLPIMGALKFVESLGQKGVTVPITDSLSTKVSIVSAAKKYNLLYCGGHPIAGGERSGFDKASSQILKGAKHILIESNNVLFEKLKEIHELIGMQVIEMDACRHDQIFSLISHIPHLIAFNLMETVLSENNEALKYTGAGFKDFTRIAGSDPVMWTNIFVDNKNNVITIAEKFIKNLEKWIDIIKKGDIDHLRSKISDVSNKRRLL